MRSERKIGIIGVTLREIANADNLKFTNEIIAVRNESSKLRQMGVNIIIVLSHCGLDRDKIIALECGDYVDVIVGGHSHSFLYTFDNKLPPTVRDVPVAPYPLVLTPKSGRNRKVLIVHASAFTKFIGDLRVYFNEDGHVKYYDGNPIYLGNEISKDPTIVSELVPWRNEILKLSKRIIGSSYVDLIHTLCRHGECELGKFVTDAFVAANNCVKTIHSAIIQASGLRNSLYSGDIQYADLIAMLPFENTLDILELRGEILYEIFEHSVSRSYVETEFIGIHMLQVSGFKVTFNTSQPVGERVHSLKIRITCDEYETVKTNKIYSVIVPSFLSNGGDGFTMMIKSKRKNHSIGIKKLLDVDLIEAYIAHKSPITIDVIEDEYQRIVMLS